MKTGASIGLLAGVVLVSAVAYLGKNISRPKPSTAAASEPAPARKSSPIVVELFTSEGCSSCPPADTLLTKLEKTQPVAGANVIALEQHVAYWNRLGWEDPFSSDEFNLRQQGYANRLGGEGVYTPQMVVDGGLGFVGSDQQQARRAISAAEENPKAEIHLVLNSDTTQGSTAQQLSIEASHVPSVTSGDKLEVILAITEDKVSSNVTRGENSGLSLQHNSVVRSLRTVGEATLDNESKYSTKTPVTFNKDWKKENVKAVVFLQEHSSRRIVGAASIPISGTELQQPSE